MFIVIGLMMLGMGLGYLLRKRQITWIHQAITILIWGLLFLLGLEVGNNRRVIEGLHTLGLEAIAITVACTLGSVLAAWGLWIFLYKRKGGART